MSLQTGSAVSLGPGKAVSGGGVRCLTRALKNAQYLRQVAPKTFIERDTTQSFGTGLPIDVLEWLHRLPHDSPALSRHKNIASFLQKNRIPAPRAGARGALFSGTIHFVQITFKVPGQNIVMPSADMNVIVQYAQRAIAALSAYAAQYGPNTVGAKLTGCVKS